MMRMKLLRMKSQLHYPKKAGWFYKGTEKIIQIDKMRLDQIQEII